MMDKIRICLWLIIGVIAEVIATQKRHLGNYLETNEVQATSCSRMMDHVFSDHVIATNPPDLRGEWTSGRCEVRPGAEFVLRKYIFLEKSQFELHQYYYSDSDCTQPSYSVVAKGRLYIGEPSWLVPGGLESEYSLTLVSLMPYNHKAAGWLTRKLKAASCPALEGVTMKPHETYSIYRFVPVDEDDEDSDLITDTDCNAALELVFHELQLVRMEVRKKDLEIRKMLYLGDIHSDRLEKLTYRPTSYQEPLYFHSTSHCHVCKRIHNSNRLRPPTIYRKHPSTTTLPGEWFSVKCEVRPIGQFLTRHLTFTTSGEWEGYYNHFADQRCHKPMFTVYVRGKFAKKAPSTEINNAFYYNISITEMRVQPVDERIVNLLNEDLGGDKCGKVASWEVGKMQDVTPTGGCAMLSLKTPSEHQELLKLEREHHHHDMLYLGQLPSATQSHHTTSFQPPLVKCGSGKSSKSLELISSRDGDVQEHGVNEAQVSVSLNCNGRLQAPAIPVVSVLIFSVFFLKEFVVV